MLCEAPDMEAVDDAVPVGNPRAERQGLRLKELRVFAKRALQDLSGSPELSKARSAEKVSSLRIGKLSPVRLEAIEESPIPFREKEPPHIADPLLLREGKP